MSFASIDSDVSNPRFGHAWRDPDGGLHSAVKLGDSTLYLDSAADARAIAAACTEAAEALDGLADGGQP
jgi:hypothetical protein